MISRLIKRQTVWCPTLLGWACLLVIFGTLAGLWCFFAEDWLSCTDRRPAEALVLEAWIGVDGIRAAKAEFDQGGYLYLVAAGALSDNRWGSKRWNYATEATEYLLRWGVPAEKMIEARARDTDSRRTFETALAARQALEKQGLHVNGINVFTVGVHARRSRLVFAKVFGSRTTVGVISWSSPTHTLGPWWNSSERSEDLLKETIGWLFEALLNSGRMSNSLTESAP